MRLDAKLEIIGLEKSPYRDKKANPLPKLTSPVFDWQIAVPLETPDKNGSTWSDFKSAKLCPKSLSYVPKSMTSSSSTSGKSELGSVVPGQLEGLGIGCYLSADTKTLQIYYPKGQHEVLVRLKGTDAYARSASHDFVLANWFAVDKSMKKSVTEEYVDSVAACLLDKAEKANRAAWKRKDWKEPREVKTKLRIVRGDIDPPRWMRRASISDGVTDSMPSPYRTARLSALGIASRMGDLRAITRALGFAPLK